MTRLFLRFYVGVVLILLIAWLVQTYITRTRSGRQNASVVEHALAGGLRLARDELTEAPEELAEDKFKDIVGTFEYPVHVISMGIDWLNAPERRRLIDGEAVLLGDYIAIALIPRSKPDKSIADEMMLTDTVTETPSGKQVDTNAGTMIPKTFLLFGPLPQFVGPSPAEIMIGYGVIFLLAAIAIAILLRPVAKQFRDVERTATAISGGDYSARIQTSSHSRNLALVNAFNTMADRTESLLRSQRELFQAVSHELRTPLARIRFATDLVETAASSEERRKRLDSIDDATETLDELVGELLTYARIESNASGMTPEPIDVWNLIEEVIDIHAPLYADIEFSLPENPDQLIMRAHRASLGRAIENLISNAGQHAKLRVSVSVKIDGKVLEINVEDDGDGIPEPDRKKVFEPFLRLEKNGRRGSGLGLSLVQRIAKQHKGEIKVSDSILGGACLTIRLPYGGSLPSKNA